MRYFNNDIFSCSGDPIHVLYSPIVKKDGSIELEKSGEENTDDIIQSYAEECDLNVILKKFEMGDESVLSKKIGAYGDFTNMPKTYAELLQMQINAKDIFDSLPLEYKNKFDNDMNKFFAEAGTDEWKEKLSPYYDNNDVKEVDEVNE